MATAPRRGAIEIPNIPQRGEVKQRMDRKIVFALFGVSVFILAASAVVIAPSGHTTTPLKSSNFIVEIDGIASSSFMAVEGLGSETEIIEYRPGNEPNEVRFLPGSARVQPLTLVRGLTDNAELWDWYEYNRDIDVDRRSMSVVIMDHGRNEKVRYNFQDCFPAAYHVEPLEALPSSVALEKLIVQCDSMDWA